MQRRAAAGTRGSSARNYRRKLMKKRHVNTWQAMHAMQHFDDLEMAKKVFHASTQVRIKEKKICCGWYLEVGGF